MFLILIGVLVCSIIFFIRLSKKNSTLKEFWQKTSKEALYLRTQLSKKENELSSSLNKIALLQNLNLELEQTNLKNKETIMAMEKNESTSLNYFKNEIKRLTLNLSSYKEQVDIMGEQLKTIDKEKFQAQRELSVLKDKASKVSISSQKDFQSLESKVVTLTNENLSLKKQIQELESETIEKLKDQQKQDEAQILKLKKHLINSSFLYKGMRGLKEMAEERNQNLEVAVRTLSKWVLEQKNMDFDLSDSQPIGSILGEALESIGQSLIPAQEDHQLESNQ